MRSLQLAVRPRGVIAERRTRAVWSRHGERRGRHGVALTCSPPTLATSSGHMRASTAAALVGAAVLSTLVFPFLGLRLRAAALDKPAGIGAVSGV